MSIGPTPEHHSGTQCGQMLGNGLLSYQCTRPLGHLTGEDPEPHYAVEVESSVRQWREWQVRQQAEEVQQAEEAQQEGRQVIDCPECAGEMVIVEEDGYGHCMNLDCGVSVRIATPAAGDEFVGTIAPRAQDPVQVPVERPGVEEEVPAPPSGHHEQVDPVEEEWVADAEAADAEESSEFSRMVLDVMRPYLREGLVEAEIHERINRSVVELLIGRIG